LIYYLVTARHHYTMSEYLGSWGKGMSATVQVVPYSKLVGQAEIPRGTYLFSDLERLGQLERSVLEQVWDTLQGTNEGVRLLNHPQRAMRRFELLEHLHQLGGNVFRAYRPGAAGRPWRYPVFVREENEHTGSRSPLLYDADDVRTVLLKMVMDGFKLSELLIVEFCDTSDDEGVYRKYAAFRIGEVILPRHVLFSHNWMLKDLDLLDACQRAEIHEYCRNNPHESEIRAAFETAKIDYGRIDYAYKDGRMQVWEINTNPIVMRAPQHYSEQALPFHQRFADAFGSAFADLDTQSPPWPMSAMDWSNPPILGT
jgi:hypothetical protein